MASLCGPADAVPRHSDCVTSLRGLDDVIAGLLQGQDVSERVRVEECEGAGEMEIAIGDPFGNS